MALVSSTMLEVGTKAPEFSLSDTDGNTVSLNEVVGKKGMLIMFISNHCPYVKHIAAELARIGDEYPGKGVGVVAIMSNDVANYPDDSPEKMKAEREQRGYQFPYLYDEDQSVAKAYRAACTPDFFVFNADRELVYRGQLDDSRPNSGTDVTGADLRAALNAVLAGETPTSDQKPSMGCNIKWKAGNEPEYFAE